MKRITWTGDNTLVFSTDAQMPGRPGPGDVLLRVSAVGLCSTDVHIIQGWLRFRNPPHVLGHEFAGIVEETGEGVNSVFPGDRVTVDSVVGCGTCRWCTVGSTQFCSDGYEIGMTVDGGMQEYIIVPERNVIPLPPGVSDADGAVLDPEVYGALRKPGIEQGSSVLIVGPGPGGLLALQLARLMGAGTVILLGTRQERLEVGKELGADHTILTSDGPVKERLYDILGDVGPDLVFDAAGSQKSMASAFDLVRPQGKVVLYGVHGSPVEKFDSDIITLKDLVVYGALSDRTGWETLLKWVADGSLNLSKIITHHFPFSRAQEAFETVRDRREGAIKALLTP